MIGIKSLSFSYGKDKILKGIGLAIRKGEFVGIAGSTGTGKSTFALCLNGLIPNSVKGEFMEPLPGQSKGIMIIRPLEHYSIIIQQFLCKVMAGPYLITPTVAHIT